MAEQADLHEAHKESAELQTWELKAIALLAGDIGTARLNTEHCLSRHLDDQYEEHAYLVKATMWRQRTCFERERRAQSNSRGPPSTSLLPEKYLQAKSPFANISTVQVPFEKSSGKDRLKDVSQEVFTNTTPKDSIVRSSWTVPSLSHKADGISIPPFKEYVSLKTNILADNQSKLSTLPYFGEDGEEQDEKVLRKKLPHIYEIRHDINAWSDLRDEQCRFYAESIEIFLEELGLTWDMVLYWLLVPDKEIREVNKASNGHQMFEKLLLERSAFDNEFFHRDEKPRKAILFERGPDRWSGFLSRIQKPSAMQLRLTSLACLAILAKCNVSPWYLARRSKTMQSYIQEKTIAAQRSSHFTFRNIACRVCHEHNCLFHGELREQPESDVESESEDDNADDELDLHGNLQPSSKLKTSHHIDDSDSDIDDRVIPAHVIEDDSDVDKVINYRIPVNAEALAQDPPPRAVTLERAIPPQGPFKATWWKKNTATDKWEKRKPFIPCAHDGSCISVKCRCFREGITCEKTCRCPSSCNRRFPGCTCAFDALDGDRTCGTEKGCLCVKFNRECDADLCGTCGATEILDPVNRYNEEVLHERCSNVGIQRGVPKKTLLGQSEVHGFGLYAGQDILKDDIVGEYTGEIISVEESARRAVIYEYEKNMYLFQLNKKQEVDATYMGNKLRFINNANKNLVNCYPKVLLCNTVFRVALYASVDIKAGTEFFFHYNYPEEMTMHFKQPKGKVVAVRQLKPVATKQKSAAIRSSSKSVDPSGENPYARQIEGLAKARAAKAAKRAAQLAELGLPATSRLKQARKSAVHSSTTYKLSRDSEVQGRHKQAPTLSRSEAVEAYESVLYADERTSTKTRGALEKETDFVVQETDDEDEPEDTQAGAEEDSVPASEVEKGLNLDAGETVRAPGRTRGRAIKSAPVFAVKNKKGGFRPGAGRKRKRPVIVNSDEE
ncbi:hypothetical protein BKA63DRAFT_409412 [Paraphoma chrysanthemicola]|nr:hypothetical protein BKA63DRAFT_409412 [Paraphoma chrysanthemicola]